MQKVSVAFADNNDIVADREEAEKNVETITNDYNDLCSATGRHIKEEKSKFYACQWAIRSRKKDVKNLDKIVKINEKELNQVHCKKNEKTLGVVMGPSLT